MTVKELIEQLKHYPEDLPVVYCHYLADKKVPADIEENHILEYDNCFVLFDLPQEK